MVFDKFGTPALRAFLNETGVGNHKELVNFMIKIGNSISEDAIADGGQPATQGARDLTSLYDTMKT